MTGRPPANASSPSPRPRGARRQGPVPLYRNCIFRSEEFATSHREISSELTNHALKWGRGAAGTSMYKGEVARLQMYVVRYGAEVQVESETFDDFSLVHMPLRGGMVVDADGTRLNVAEGRAAYVAPKRSLRLHCLAGAERLVLKMPNDILGELTSPGDDPAMGSGFMVPRALGPQWMLLMRSLLGVLSIPPEADVHAGWVAHFERSVALFLIGHRPADARPRIASTLTGPEPDRLDQLALVDGNRRMDAVLSYMRQRLGAPVALCDLARAGRVSERTLNVLCRRFNGMTPMELLRNMRLDAIRAKLMLQRDVNITAAAIEFGFGHVGRFAAYYKARFNELPSETQAQHHRH